MAPARGGGKTARKGPGKSSFHSPPDTLKGGGIPDIPVMPPPAAKKKSSVELEDLVEDVDEGESPLGFAGPRERASRGFHARAAAAARRQSLDPEPRRPLGVFTHGPAACRPTSEPRSSASGLSGFPRTGGGCRPASEPRSWAGPLMEKKSARSART